MQRCRSGLFYLSTLATLMAQATYAEEVVLYGIHFPPYAIDANITPPVSGEVNADNIYGVDVDIIRAAYASQGIDVTFKLGPWKRIMRDVEAGLILGVVSCRPMASRESFSYFSNSVSHSTMVMATQKGYWGEEQSHPLEKLKHEDTVVMAGWAQETILTRQSIPYSVVNGISQGVSLVLHRNQDVFMTDQESLVYVLDQMDVKDQFSLYKIDTIDYRDYAVCFSKKFEQSEQLRNSLNQGLEVLHQSGKIQAVYKYYGIVDPTLTPNL